MLIRRNRLPHILLSPQITHLKLRSINTIPTPRIHSTMLPRHIIQHLPRQLNIVIRELANLGVVNTQNLRFFGGAKAQSGDQVHDEEDETGAEEGVGEAGAGVGDLVAELDPVPVEPAAGDGGHAVEVRYVVCREEAGEDIPDEASNSVLREDVEGIVNTKDELQLRRVVGSRGAQDAVDDGRPRGDVTTPRRNRDQPGHNTRAEPDRRPLLLESVVENTPRDASHRCRQVRDYSGHYSPQIRRQRRSSIEAEPTHPQEHRADNNMRDVVRPVIQLVRAVAASLA